MSQKSAPSGKQNKFRFDFLTTNKYTGMGCLHYACQFPSLTMLIDILGNTNTSPIEIDSFLRLPSQLIPLSHLTSKKSILTYEKEKMFLKLYPKPKHLETMSPELNSRDDISEYLKEKMKVPLEKSFSFDENEEHSQEITQRPRCFPTKATIFIKMKSPSEKFISKVPSLKMPRKIDNSMHELSKPLVVPKTTLINRNSINAMAGQTIPKPMRLSLKTIPNIKVASSMAVGYKATPGREREEAIEKITERLKIVS